MSEHISKELNYIRDYDKHKSFIIKESDSS